MVYLRRGRSRAVYGVRKWLGECEGEASVLEFYKCWEHLQRVLWDLLLLLGGLHAVSREDSYCLGPC